MKAQFLPKTLDGIGTRKYIVDYQAYRSRTGMHWHNCIEIIYIEQGNIQFFFNNKWYEMYAGDMVFIPPQRIHYMFCDNDVTIKTVIGVTKNLICDEDINDEKIILPFETEKINEHCFFKDDGELLKIINKLNSIENSPVGSLLIQAEILRVYAYVYNEWIKKGLSFIEPIRDKTVYDIIHILESEFASAPSAYEMANRLNISYSHMCRILSDKLATNYNAILFSIRIENAKKLLLSTDKNITEIGFDCGFGDSSYFIKTFKKIVGITPLKYRAYNINMLI